MHGEYGNDRRERSPIEVEEVEAWPQGLNAAHSLIVDRFSRRKSSATGAEPPQVDWAILWSTKTDGS